MIMHRPEDNPFDLQKASNYSSEEIQGHWVDIASQHGGLVSVLAPTAITPMLLLGGKGSGKTHLMRFCSAPVQAQRHGGVKKAIRAEGYVGVYVLAEALNTHKFSGKNVHEETWAAVFAMYFEAWLVNNLLLIMRDVLESQFDKELPENFTRAISDIFPVAKPDIRSLDNLLTYLTNLREKIDFVVNNSALSGSVTGLEVPFSTGALLFGISDLVADAFPDLKNPVILFLIDELENFTEDQQRFLNTLIRYRKGRATIKVGARLYGVKTLATLGSGEPIKQGAEYIQVELDRFLREHHTEYRSFAVDLTLSRLRRAGSFTGVRGEEDLISSFEVLEQSENHRSEALALVGRSDTGGRPRRHLASLLRKLSEFGVNEAVASAVVENLRNVDNPFIEKLNTFIFIRSWNGDLSSAVEQAGAIKHQAEALEMRGRAGAADYTQIMDHFSSDILAQMYREARRPLPYAGFDSMIEVSQGIPRNLLGILSHMYRRATFAGERPFQGGKISVSSQTYGVLEGAKAFWNEAQPDADVVNVRNAIEALALLFRSIRFSDKPSECDVCTFSVNVERLSARARAVLRTAENWSCIVRIERGSKNKNRQSLDPKFQFSPMLAPLWEISHHRRGVIELQPDLANAVFDPEAKDNLVDLVKARVSRMSAPKVWGALSAEDAKRLVQPPLL